MKFSDGAKGYRSYDGEYIVLTNDGLGDDNYFSPNGLMFYQLKQTSHATGKGFDFEDPNRQVKGRIDFVANHLVIHDGRKDERIYRLSEIPKKVKLVYIPHARVGRYFGRLKQTGELFYVSCDRYYEEPVKFFRGFPGNMVEVADLKVDRTCKQMETGEGLILACYQDGSMVWEGLCLEIHMDEYYVNETENGLEIRNIGPAKKNAKEIAFTVEKNS